MDSTGSSIASTDVPAAKPYEPNAVLRWLYRRFFSHIHLDGQWSASLRQVAERGVVVHVMRSISFLDFLCLDFLTKRFGLPALRFANDLGLWILEPFGKGRRRLRFRRQIPEETALSETLGAGHSALLFLRKPPHFARPGYRGRRLEVDLIRVLVETQRRTAQPILLVPQVFVWNKLPPLRRRGLLDLVFGPSEWPGKIRVFFQFLRNYRNALLRSGEPFDLASFLAAHPDLSDDRVADKVRYAMLRRIEREHRVVVGPSMKTPQRIREELLRSPRLRAHVQAAARASKRTEAVILREAEAELRKLCASPNPTALAIIHRVLDRVWNRLYDGLVVDRHGIERVREAARKGTVVLLPSHKSHMDYIVLSDVFYANDLSCPIIAAGDNLSFWPLGPWLRRAGAFFIRRALHGRKLYSALLDAYIRKLLQEGFSLEVFLEGGRSRTGKLLPPQVGLLAMIVDGALALRNKPVFFVPISIAYERIIEERSYVRELAGDDKEREDLSTLLKTPRVFRSRYGRLYIEFGEIFSFHDGLREATNVPSTNATEGDPHLSPKQRRNLIQHIAHRAVREIHRATVITPASLVASALLAHRRRGMTHRELIDAASSLLASARRFGARVTRPVTDEDGMLSEQAVDEAIGLFLDGRLLVRHGEGSESIYRVPGERRIALEYYKNNVLHFFAPNAILATGLLADGAEPVTEDTLRDRFDALSRLFEHEFISRSPGDEQDFERLLTNMIDSLEVERFEGKLRPGAGRAGAKLQLYAGFLRSYFESYVLALRGLQHTPNGDVAVKDWTKRTLALGHRMYLAGEIEKRETLSRSKLENVLKALHDRGIVRVRSNGQLNRVTGDEAGEALRLLEVTVQTYAN